jgi:tol-pal system protein YbgF
MRDYQSGHFSLAQKEFSNVISQYPSSYLAGSAQFWIGQSLFYSKKYKESIDAYNQLIQKYPESGKKADAFYKRAMAYELLGEKSKAIHYYKRILDVFPGERDLDEKAKRRIKSLE